MFCKVLSPNLDLVGSRAIENLNNQITPIFGNVSNSDLVLAVALAKNFRILLGSVSHFVEAHARSVIRHHGIVETAAVRKHGHVEVESQRQSVTEVLVTVDVEEMNLCLIFPALTKLIGQNLGIATEIHRFHIGRVIRTHRIRIDEHLFFPVGAIALIDDVLILIGETLPVDVASVAHIGKLNGSYFPQLCESGFQLVASGTAVKQSMCVSVLTLDPSSSLWALLILEPSIWIDYGDSMHRLSNIDTGSVRRRW